MKMQSKNWQDAVSVGWLTRVIDCFAFDLYMQRASFWTYRKVVSVLKQNESNYEFAFSI